MMDAAAMVVANDIRPYCSLLAAASDLMTRVQEYQNASMVATEAMIVECQTACA
jgi:hypothetical protein